MANFEAQLEKSLQKLASIEPDSDWVQATKRQILKEDSRRIFNFDFLALLRNPFAYAALTVVIFSSLAFFGFWQSAKAPVVSLNPFLQKDPSFYLNLAEKNIDSVTQIAKKGTQTELSERLQDTTRVIQKAISSLPKKPKSPQQTQEIIEKVTRINQKMEQVRAALGEEVAKKETEQLTQKAAQLVREGIKEKTKDLISVLEKTSLTQEQEKMLDQAKQDYDKGNFEKALELILRLSNLTQNKK